MEKAPLRQKGFWHRTPLRRAVAGSLVKLYIEIGRGERYLDAHPEMRRAVIEREKMFEV
jgi:hypothetical protein